MIRVFIGTDGDIHGKAEKVIEYSILKHASEPVSINFMRPIWKSGCTGFTNHRFLIPSMCGYDGFAIYFDVDMLLLDDIAKLWAFRTPGKWCTTPYRDDVSVIDCSAFADLSMPYARLNKKDTIRRMIGARQLSNIPQGWNTIDTVNPDAKLIHYSDLNTQPWHPIPGHPYKDHKSDAAVEIFWQYYAEATGNESTEDSNPRDI